MTNSPNASRRDFVRGGGLAGLAAALHPGVLASALTGPSAGSSALSASSGTVGPLERFLAYRSLSYPQPDTKRPDYVVPKGASAAPGLYIVQAPLFEGSKHSAQESQRRPWSTQNGWLDTRTIKQVLQQYGAVLDLEQLKAEIGALLTVELADRLYVSEIRALTEFASNSHRDLGVATNAAEKHWEFNGAAFDGVLGPGNYEAVVLQGYVDGPYCFVKIKAEAPGSSLGGVAYAFAMTRPVALELQDRVNQVRRQYDLPR